MTVICSTYCFSFVFLNQLYVFLTLFWKVWGGRLGEPFGRCLEDMLGAFETFLDGFRELFGSKKVCWKLCVKVHVYICGERERERD